MRYDLIADMRHCVSQLQQQLAILAQDLNTLKVLQARVFILPPAKKGEELLDADRIPVEQVSGLSARSHALQHFQRLFMQQQSEQLSTRTATRLPGAICVQTSQLQQAQLADRISEINQLKQRLALFITKQSGLPSSARFPFVHQHFPGLITLNAYRSIHLISDISTINFGWANKHVIRNVNKEEMISHLQKSLQSGRSKAPWSKQQWALKINQELALLAALPAQAELKIKRPVKVQPIARIWRSEQKRQQQLACPSPIIICCQPDQSLPEIGSLDSYDKLTIKHRHNPPAQSLRLLIPRLWLWVAN